MNKKEKQHEAGENIIKYPILIKDICFKRLI